METNTVRPIGLVRAAPVADVAPQALTQSEPLAGAVSHPPLRITQTKLEPLAAPSAERKTVATRPTNGPHPVTDPRPSVPARDINDALQAAENSIQAWLGRATSPPSVQLAVTYKGNLVRATSLGVKDLTTGAPATNDTLYQINSMTKSLTAASVMQLVEAGHLSLDTPVVSIIPEFARVGGPPELVNAVTVRKLLSHTAGLSRDVPLDVWNPDHYWESGAWPSWSDVVEHLPENEVQANPKGELKYSNLGMALLGQVVSRVSGMPYQEYVRSHIFEPLGMHDSTFTLDDAAAARMATGYSSSRVVNGVAGRNQAVVLRDPGALVSAAGCRSTATDVARWLSFLRDPSSVPGVLSPASVAAMRATAAVDDSNFQYFGFGLITRTLTIGNPAFGHMGSGMGFTSAMRETIDGSFGVVALTNDFSRQADRVVDMVMTELADVAKAAPAPGAPPRDPAWAEFVGPYLAANSNKATAVRTNASGDLLLDGAPLRPVPDSPDTFRIVGGDRVSFIYETVIFRRDPQSREVIGALVGGTSPEHAQIYYPRMR